MYGTVICRFCHLPSNGVIAKIVRCDLALLFESKKNENFISETVRAGTKFVGDICRFRHMPSNGVIAKIAALEYLAFLATF